MYDICLSDRTQGEVTPKMHLRANSQTRKTGEHTVFEGEAIYNETNFSLTAKKKETIKGMHILQRAFK